MNCGFSTLSIRTETGLSRARDRLPNEGLLIPRTRFLRAQRFAEIALQVDGDNHVAGFASRETLKESREGSLEAILLVDL
jgi:hypothetical protein